MSANSFEEILQNIVADFFNTFDIPQVTIKYSITDDMISSYTELCPEHARKEPEKIAGLNKFNGTTVPPKSIDGVFTILLNQKMIVEYINQNNATWVGTIVHETAHVVDFTNYAKMINAEDYSDILSGTMDAYASVISNNLNIVMKRLTSISIILMLPTLVASLYGMNVPNSLENNPYGFLIALLISFLFSVFGFVIFKWRHWI